MNQRINTAKVSPGAYRAMAGLETIFMPRSWNRDLCSCLR